MAHAAHSIYFQVLGDLGFVGLALYLLLLAAAWRNASLAIKHSLANPEVRWAHDLARTFQYCLLPFIVSGAALSMAYFDLAFVLVALTAVLREETRVQAAMAARSTVGMSTIANRPAST